MPIGSSQYHIALSAIRGQVGAEIYINDNKELFNTFLSKKEAIENDLGFSMDWRLLPEKKACRIIITKEGDFTDPANETKFFEWYCEKAIAFKQVFPKYAE